MCILHLSISLHHVYLEFYDCFSILNKLTHGLYPHLLLYCISAFMLLVEQLEGHSGCKNFCLRNPLVMYDSLIGFHPCRLKVPKRG